MSSFFPVLQSKCLTSRICCSESNRGPSLRFQSNATGIENLVIKVETVDGEEISTADVVTVGSPIDGLATSAASETSTVQMPPIGSTHTIVVVVLTSSASSISSSTTSLPVNTSSTPHQDPYTPLPPHHSYPSFSSSPTSPGYSIAYTPSALPSGPSFFDNLWPLPNPGPCRRSERAVLPNESSNLFSSLMSSLPFTSFRPSYVSGALKRHSGDVSVDKDDEDEDEDETLFLPIKRRRTVVGGTDRSRRRLGRRM